MFRAGFYEGCLGFRGTTRAILAYAKGLQDHSREISSTYYFQKSNKNNLQAAKLFISSGIAIEEIQNVSELSEKSLDFLYHITSAAPGEINWLKDKAAKTLLHQVGVQKPDTDASTYFAYASHWQSFSFTDGKAHVLPHVIENPADIMKNCPAISKQTSRIYFDIPNNAIVLGRHGGIDTWNLPFVNSVISDIIQTRKDLYFLFLNTPKFIDHPQVKFIEGTHDNYKREIYLSACDAMLHARWEGETFGLACAEFLIRQKPVISWAESRERNHFLMSENSIITYNLPFDLHALLQSISTEFIEHKRSLIPSWISERYTSEPVSKQLINLINQNF